MFRVAVMLNRRQKAKLEKLAKVEDIGVAAMAYVLIRKSLAQ